MKTFRQDFRRICFYKNISLAEQTVSVIYETEEECEVVAFEKLWGMEWTRNYEGPVKGGPGYSSWLIGKCKEIKEKYEDIPDRPAPKVDFSNPIPDITESVFYNGVDFLGNKNRWRVSGWYCQDEKRPWKLRTCTREEAQVFSLSGVCGAIVRPDQVERSGEYVKWSAQRIETERDRVLQWAGNDCDIEAKRYLPDAPEKPTEEEFMKQFMDEVLGEIHND
jgi:hypothetical protein